MSSAAQRGRRPKTAWRDLHGIVLLDKPSGISSNQALQRARHRLRAAKGGHAGSLDPLATGMLPLCLGEATRLSAQLLGNRKAYTTRAVLGITTDSGDADGAVLLQRQVPVLQPQQLETVLHSFRGRIRQRPPNYSALHVDGQRAYELARRGVDFALPEREVDIHQLQLLAMDSGSLQLQVECGSGTYIRSLVSDIGEALGCGAHVAELRREWVAPFQGQAMHTLDHLQAIEGDEAAMQACVLPMSAALPGAQTMTLTSRDDIIALSQGRAIAALDLAPGSDVAVLSATGRLLALGEIDQRAQFLPNKVFIRSGVEPALAEA